MVFAAYLYSIATLQYMNEKYYSWKICAYIYIYYIEKSCFIWCMTRKISSTSTLNFEIREEEILIHGCSINWKEKQYIFIDTWCAEAFHVLTLQCWYISLNRMKSSPMLLLKKTIYTVLPIRLFKVPVSWEV